MAENKAVVTLDDKVTPKILELHATILALANTLLTDEQWDKFNEHRVYHMKELVSGIVKENPRLLEESPELAELLKPKD